MNLFRKTFALVALSIVALLIIGNILIDNPLTHRFLKNLINNELKQSTNLTLDFESVSVRLLPLRATAFGVKIVYANPENPEDTERALYLSSVGISVSVLDIILGKKRVSSIDLNGLNISWPPDFDVAKLLKKTPSKKKEFSWPPSFAPPVVRVNVINSKLYFQKTSSKKGKTSVFEIGSDAVNISLQVSAWDKISGRLNFKHLNSNKNGQDILENAEFFAEFKYSKNYLKFTTVELDSKKLQLSGESKGSLLSRLVEMRTPSSDNPTESESSSQSGQPLSRSLQKIDRFLRSKAEKKISGIKVDFPHKVSGDLSFLGSILDIPKVDGLMSASGDLSIYMNFEDIEKTKISYNAQVTSKSARFFDFNLMQSVIDLRIINDRILFKNIDFIDGDHKFMSSSGTLIFDDQVSYDFRLIPDGLRLSHIFKILNKDFDAVDFELENNSLLLKGVGKPFTMTLVGKHQLKNFSLPVLKSSNYARSPTCDSNINITINSTLMSFDGSKLKCAPYAFGRNTKLTNLDYSDIDFSGRLHFKDKTKTRLSLISPNFNLRNLDFITNDLVRGIGSLDVAISSSNDKPVIASQFKFLSAGVYDLELGELAGGLRYSDEVLTWGSVVSSFKNQGSFKLLDGKLSDFKNLYIDTQVRARNLHHAQTENFFSRIFGDKNFSFNLDDFNGSIRGPLRQPFLWNSSFACMLSDVRSGPDKIFDLLRFKSKSTDEVFSMSEISGVNNSLAVSSYIRLQKNRIASDASNSSNPSDSTNSIAKVMRKLGAQDSDQLDARLDLSSASNTQGKSSVNDLASMPFVGATLAKLGLSGEVSGNVALSGLVGNPSLVSSSSLRNLRFKDALLEEVDLRSSLADGQLNVSLAQGSQLSGSLDLDIGNNELAYKAKLRADQLDLKWLLLERVAPDSLASLQTSLNWKISGRLDNWWKSNGLLEISDIHAIVNDLTAGQLKKIKVQQHGVARLVSEDGEWTLEKPLVVRNDRFDFQVKPFKNQLPYQLDVDVTSNIHLDVLPKFYRKIESATGTLAGSMKLRGSLNEPNIAAKLECSKSEPVGISISSLRPSFEDVSCYLTYEEGVLYVQDFEAKKGLGSIKASGALVLNSEKSKRNLSGIRLAMNNAKFIVPVKYFKYFDSILSGNLYITGNKRPYQMSGTVNVLRALATRDFNVDQEIVSNLRRKSYNFSEVTTAPLFNLNIDINAEKTIKVRNKIVQTNFSSRLNILGDSGSPILTGQMTIHEGNFLYKRPFKLSNSFLVFDNPLKNDPNLDITATTDVGGRRIYLKLYGKLSNAVVDLTADPPTRDDGSPLSKLDLLVLISTGELPETGQIVDKTGSAAQVEAINFFTNQFNKPLQKILNLSGQEFIREPTIKFEISKVTGGIVPRLNVPINLKDNYKLNVGVNSSGAWEVSSEYPINESISLSGSFEGVNSDKVSSTSNQIQTENRDAALDVKFRFNFK